MQESTSERRLAENEVIFRKLNKQFVEAVAETNRVAAEDGQPEYMIGQDGKAAILRFFCECSDEKCGKRIKLSLKTYEQLHLSAKRFVIAPGHDTPAIERIIQSHDPEYIVVEKLWAPPQDASELHPTSLSNT